ncbi:MAG: manganese transporter [Chloroflexi bacterium]|nr:manganese transporter [Chloroflexota bacterium]
MLRLILAVTLLVVACVPANVPSTRAIDIAGRRIQVVATTGMVADLVRNVGGVRVEVAALMGPGVDPHLYKPSAGDINRLENADIIFYNGLELEGRMTDLFVKMARVGKPTVPVTDGVTESRLREPPEFEGKYDPHIWFDVTLWQETIPVVARELSRVDPSSEKVFEANAAAYTKELGDLHRYVQTLAGEVAQPSRVLITAHDAFGYFGQAYGFEVKGLQGISTATEAGAADVQDLAAFIAERKVKAIFVESSVSRAAIEAVQAAVRARGFDVQVGGELFSDAMGAEGTPEGTYVGMFKHNAETIARALK